MYMGSWRFLWIPMTKTPQKSLGASSWNGSWCVYSVGSRDKFQSESVLGPKGLQWWIVFRRGNGKGRTICMPPKSRVPAVIRIDCSTATVCVSAWITFIVSTLDADGEGWWWVPGQQGWASVAAMTISMMSSRLIWPFPFGIPVPFSGQSWRWVRIG